jgi:hypothetical protein
VKTLAQISTSSEARTRLAGPSERGLLAEGCVPASHGEEHNNPPVFGSKKQRDTLGVGGWA